MDTIMVTGRQQDAKGKLLKLYKEAFPLVARYVAGMGGSFDDARDIFQDALISYYERAAAGNLTLKYSEKTYVAGIARKMWSRRFAEDKVKEPLSRLNEEPEFEEYPGEPASGKLMRLLSATGQKCLELLSAFYYHRFSMAEIADSFGFAGERSATVQKFKCLEKVRNTVKERSLSYEDFFE